MKTIVTKNFKSIPPLKELLKRPVFWLIVVALIGAFFRFYNLNWDYYHSFHPDERNIFGQTASIHESTGFRVTFFSYGQFSIYLYRATAEILSAPQIWADAFGVHQTTTFLCNFSYWIFLALIVGLLAYLCLWNQEQRRKKIFWSAGIIFTGLVLFEVFPIFIHWFDFLRGWQAHVSSLFLVAIVAYAVAGVYSKVFEIDWISWPFYIASGAVFIFGIIPMFLPIAFSQTFGLFAFVLILLSLAWIWAWVSKWGRFSLSLLSVSIILILLKHATPNFINYSREMIIGRGWEAIFSTLTIFAVYYFVEKAYKNQFLAFLAAAFFSFSVISIQLAHFGITESCITFLVVVTAIASYDVVEHESWRSYLIAGAAFGLSMAAKTSSLYYILIFASAHLISLAKKNKMYWLQQDRRNKENYIFRFAGAVLIIVLNFIAFLFVAIKFRPIISDLFYSEPQVAETIWIILFLALFGLGTFLSIWAIAEFKVLRGQIHQWIKFLSSIGLGVFLFFLFSPWSLLDFSGFMKAMNYEWSVVSLANACYVLQFKNTLRYIFQLQNLVNVELWIPLGITTIVGMVWVIWKLVWGLLHPVAEPAVLPVPFSKKKSFNISVGDFLLLSWFVPYFVFIGAWNTKFIRYMVPLIPFFCIFGAIVLVDFFSWLQKIKIKFFKVIRIILVTLVLGGSLFYSLAFMHVYFHRHPWIKASIWMYKHIPYGSTILTEVWDDSLPTWIGPSMSKSVTQILNPSLYRNIGVNIYNLPDNTLRKKEMYARVLKEGDYISISSKKLWYTLTDETPEFRPHGYNKYPVTSRYYRLLWSGLLGYQMVAEFHNFPSFLGWTHDDDAAEETFSVYDHPHVYIFKKVRDVPSQVIIKLLSTNAFVKGINRSIMLTIAPHNLKKFMRQRIHYLKKRGLWKKLQKWMMEARTSQNGKMVNLTHRSKPRDNVLIKQINTRQVHAPSPVNFPVPLGVPKLPSPKVLKVLNYFKKHPVFVSNVFDMPEPRAQKIAYEVRAWISWVLLIIVLGWIALPLTLKVLEPFPSGAYSISKVLGMLFFGWIVWVIGSYKILPFSMLVCWIMLLLMIASSAILYMKNWKNYYLLFQTWKKSWITQEVIFIGAFSLFTFIRIFNPHIHDPIGNGYNGGGEAGMDFGFLASIVRGRTFPPQDMWMAGQPIGYSMYFGHIIIGVLTKTLGLVPAITYNLGIITLFALIFLIPFAIAYSLSGRWMSGWIAGYLCAMAGNLAGANQYLHVIKQCITNGHWGNLIHYTFDFWGPSRVIPYSINEFPFFSVLFADLHEHTLAMPFGMLYIAMLAALYVSCSNLTQLKKYSWFLVPLGFVYGGITFINTWEIPTWGTLTVIALLVMLMPTLKTNVLSKSIKIIFSVGIVMLMALAWFGFVDPSKNYMILGGHTRYIAIFGFISFLIVLSILWKKPQLQSAAKQLWSIFVFLVLFLIIAVIFWLPYFIQFHPQKHDILWVKPQYRTSLSDYLIIYASFLSIVGIGFIPAYATELLGSIQANFKRSKIKDYWQWIYDYGERIFQKWINPSHAVSSMLSLGVASLIVIVGASWVHFTYPLNLLWISISIATIMCILWIMALFSKKSIFWILFLIGGLCWIALLMSGIIGLQYHALLTLNLGIFSVLWIMAFANLGFAIRVRKNRALSFIYILISEFFFITATVEIFAIQEYLGGKWMRNNTLFKYGINAWTLGSISAGAIAPWIFDFIKKIFKTIRREKPWFRPIALSMSTIFIALAITALFSQFHSVFSNPAIYIFELMFIEWGWIWLVWNKKIPQWFGWIGGVFILLFLLLPVLWPNPAFGTVLYFMQNFTGNFRTGFLFSLVLSTVLIISLTLNNKIQVSKLLAQSWIGLISVLFIMTLVYPIAASISKCHGFFATTRKASMGYNERPTLDGLNYMKFEDPYDWAAIRFLNDNIPGQPCLIEAVGLGYNTWGSRYSIFTGIPALMGWNDHEEEWVGQWENQAIVDRYNATVKIYNTQNKVLAQKLLNAYGVRLIIVGPLERGELEPPFHYNARGLRKFKTMLPLIYKNPEVAIYYNPPSQGS